MDNIPVVGGPQPLRDLDSPLKSLSSRNTHTGSLICDVGFQRLALDIFHHEEETSILVVDLIDAKNVRMIECRGCFRFLHEAGLIFSRGGEVGWEKFDGDRPVELEILSFINNSHAPLPQFLENLIMGNRLP